MKVLDQMPAGTRFGSGGKEKYPYDQWFDGNPNFLERGVDFQCSVASLDSSVRSAAKKRGVKVRALRTTLDGTEGLAVQLQQEQEHF